ALRCGVTDAEQQLRHQLTFNGQIPGHRPTGLPVGCVRHGQARRDDKRYVLRRNKWRELCGERIQRISEIRIIKRYTENLHLWTPRSAVDHVVIRFDEGRLIEQADASANRRLSGAADVVREAEPRTELPVSRLAAARGTS